MSAVQPVMYERLNEAVRALKIELSPVGVENVGCARVNNYMVLVGTIGNSSMFVRIDERLEAAVERNPKLKPISQDVWMSRCNQLAAAIAGVKALVAQFEDNTLLRVETTTDTIAGFDDAQLTDAITALLTRAIFAMDQLLSVSEDKEPTR